MGVVVVHWESGRISVMSADKFADWFGYEEWEPRGWDGYAVHFYKK